MNYGTSFPFAASSYGTCSQYTLVTHTEKWNWSVRVQVNPDNLSDDTDIAIDCQYWITAQLFCCYHWICGYRTGQTVSVIDMRGHGFTGLHHLLW